VKKLLLSRAALTLLAPGFVLCLVLLGSFPGGGATDAFAKSKKSAEIQVGFVTNLTGTSPFNFQNVFLNVVAVRLNPKPNPNKPNQKPPTEGDKSWVTIPVPSGIGTSASSRPGDLQIDMLAGQSQAQLFNTFGTKVNTYQTIEVILDAVNPGMIVPVCPGAGAFEGCIAYPLALSNPGQSLTFTASVPTVKSQTTQLLIQLTLDIVTQPTVSGGFYTVNVIPSAAAPATYFANLTGTVGGTTGSNTPKKVRKMTVSAELLGTGTVIATSLVNSANGNYSLSLPAASDALGTAYDLFASGGAGTYEAERVPAVFPGANPQTGPDFPNVTTGQPLGTISGTVVDNCTGAKIVGATVQLLIPPDSNSGADCSATPGDCVTVATGNTDNTGHFPLPGTASTPAPFANVPLNNQYTMEVSAPGYDPQFVTAEATAASKGGKCGPTGSQTACSLSMTTAYLVGKVILGANPPSGSNTLIEVFAEDTGTNKLESALPMPLTIRGPSNSASFVLNVPSQAGNFDLFASAIDLYQGAADPYPGHTIGVISNVAPQQTCQPSIASPFTLSPMNCTGHGSITGAVTTPFDSGTSVLLEKPDPSNTSNLVQLMSTLVGPLPPAPSPGNAYSFCVPPEDSYLLQRLEQGAPVGGPTPVGAMPVPAATASPCPSTCSNGDNTCPGVCANAAQNPL
jgi:hypothetical protein